MPVTTLKSAQKFEDKGHAEVEFVGFRYTGDASMKADLDIRERAGYNGPAKFQQGQVYLALLPTYLDPNHVENANMGVHALEARNDFEVIYDAKRLAEALLERNYLPPEVFYEGFDRYKRKKLFEKLSLDDHGRVFGKDDEEPYRDGLRAIAGIERDEAAEVSQQRTDEYIQRFSRSQAADIVRTLQAPATDPPFEPSDHTIDELEAKLETDDDEKWDDETLEVLYVAEQNGDDRAGARNAIEDVLGDSVETDSVIDLETAGLTDMAEFLTRFEPDVVETTVAEVTGEE
ncbi:hypothetical protein C440_05662 [Haloferax mucosum ATCC BAA-1512]|uniref:Uncharacterized protein n=1 Tax=Haloferax mucosum ATCC BAA-1512 TaxID=662479 RepID=M0IJ56_9EURY|nr:hypothetical protein [Haloferax mucosum]ELZ96052.1 hypothetical protein C440_05662 [Haloferax mucosum ATCC BAA-1512]